MDILALLISINKISLVAFLTILGFLVYELYLMRKEQEKKTKPLLPNFDELKARKPNFKSLEISGPESSNGTSNKLLITILFLMLVLFGVITLVGNMANSSKKITTEGPKVIIQTAVSKGIKMYDVRWREITTNLLKDKLNENLYIGVETIKEADIDYARIRVNKNIWSTDDITMQFNPEKRVYYKRLKLGIEKGQLKIEAQLHSAADGWLGE